MLRQKWYQEKSICFKKRPANQEFIGEEVTQGNENVVV
jgi:hypothetical protein